MSLGVEMGAKQLQFPPFMARPGPSAMSGLAPLLGDERTCPPTWPNRREGPISDIPQQASGNPRPSFDSPVGCHRRGGHFVTGERVERRLAAVLAADVAGY